MPRRSVLILDDDGDIRAEAAELIVSAGHDVFEAAEASALDERALAGMDVLLLDLALPGTDGLDVLRQLGAMMRAPSIVVMSGHGQDVLRAASYVAEDAGLNVLGALQKPLDQNDLLRAVSADHPHALSKLPSPPSSCVLPALSAALDEGTLRVGFQPKVRTSDLVFAGAEALLWNELPGLGPIDPPCLVAVAAGSPGMLVRLTHEVLRQAAIASAELARTGHPAPVSVNVPIEALVEPDGIASLHRIVEAAGAEPSSIILELVEDSLYDSSADVVATLAKLRLAGFGLALDDVGRRQSGLMQLANLPVTELKIDIELVRQARRWTKARDIFASLAVLGNSIGISVVAEGVEFSQDLALARQYPVDFIQGFLVSRKLHFDELARMLNRNIL